MTMTQQDFDAAARASELTRHLDDGPLRDLDVPPEDPYADLPPIGGQDDAEDEQSAFQQRVAALNAELLDTHTLSEIPRLEPLVDGFLYVNTTARVNGASGAMKSFVLLDVAGHVGTGRPWRGRKVKQGTVVRLVAEGAAGEEKRVRAWEQHYGIPMENVLFLPRPVQAKNPEWDVLTAVCKLRNAALIICDTQARITVGVEENSAKEMGEFIDRVESMRIATGACVVLVHHQGVNGERGRGSTSVKGAMQTELRVSREGKGLADTRITVISDKQKDDEEAEDLVFALEQQVIKGMAKEDGTPITSVVLVPAEPGEKPNITTPPKPHRLGREDRVHDVLIAKVDGEPMTVKEIGDALAAEKHGPLAARTIQDALNKLSAKGAAEVAGTRGFAQTWRLAAQKQKPEGESYAQEAL